MQITPSDLPFAITGTGLPGAFNGDVRYKLDNQTSDGNDQKLLFTPDAGQLQASCGITEGSITWMVKATCCPGDAGTLDTAMISGVHEIFRTFAEPITTGLPFDCATSLRRMRTFCDWAEGATTEREAILAFVDKFPLVKQAVGWDEDGHDLRMLDGNDAEHSADCDDHCDGFCAGLRLLGLQAARESIVASTDNDCVNNLENKVVNFNGVNYNADLAFATDAAGVQGDKATDHGGNKYQGVVVAGGNWWDIYTLERVEKSSPQAMFNWFTRADDGIFPAQYWVFLHNGINTIFESEPIPDLDED